MGTKFTVLEEEVRVVLHQTDLGCGHVVTGCFELPSQLAPYLVEPIYGLCYEFASQVSAAFGCD